MEQTKYVIKIGNEYVDASGIAGFKGRYKMTTKDDASTFEKPGDLERYATKHNISGYEVETVEKQVTDVKVIW